MKNRISFLVSAFVLITSSQMTFAAFTIDELQTATKAAVETFAKMNPDHVVHFTGYKAWKSGEESKVKVYITHDGANSEYNYLCHKHDGLIECHAQ